MKKIKFSVIIPAKNEENRLPQCIEAIKNSLVDKDEVEIIVVDNGSIDKTAEAAKNNKTTLISLPNANISQLRNVGASFATGEILSFIDADVVIEKRFFDSAQEHFSKSSVAIVTGPIKLPDRSTWVENAWALNREMDNVICKIRWSSSMNMIVKRDSFFKVGGFDKDMDTCEDVDLCNRILKEGKDIIYDYRVQVIHVGEAKTLYELYKKERWRGRSALQLLYNNISDVYRWYSIVQIVFFITAINGFMISMISGNWEFLITWFLCIVFLPLLRAIIVARKKGKYYKVPHLFAVWMVYYFGRTTAILYDNMIGRSKRK